MYITPKYKWTTYTSLVPENKMNEVLGLTGYPSWPDLELVSVSTSSKAQSHKTAPSDMHFYSTWLQISGFPWPPHTFRFNNLLECLKELRKTRLALTGLFQKIQLRTSQMEEMHRATCIGGGGRQSFQVLLGHATLPARPHTHWSRSSSNLTAQESL